MSQIATGCLRAFLIVALVHYLVSYDFFIFHFFSIISHKAHNGVCLQVVLDLAVHN